jgi:hypothetical protein
MGPDLHRIDRTTQKERTMKRLIRSGIGLCAVLMTLVVSLGVAGAAGPATTCTADLQIFTTTVGDVSTAGPITFFRDSGVAGQYTSGFLRGYQFSGSQDIMLNTRTGQSQLHGSYTAVGPDGTLTIRYNGHADTTTGAATGNFVTAGGTGAFADFHWSGSITARQPVVGVPFFNATDSGTCNGLP